MAGYELCGPEVASRILLLDHCKYEWDSRESSDHRQRQPHRFSCVSVKTAGDEHSYACAKRDAGARKADDLRQTKSPLNHFSSIS